MASEPRLQDGPTESGYVSDSEKVLDDDKLAPVDAIKADDGFVLGVESTPSPTEIAIEGVQVPVPISSRGQVAKKRKHVIDNLRAILIALLILQHAVLETVATTEHPFQLQQTSPTSLQALTLFVTVNKMLVVSMLFFLSGLASRYNSLLDCQRTPDFLWRKTWKTALASAGYHLTDVAIRKYYGTPSDTGPYYSAEASRNAILRGPIFYVTFLLILDYLFALSRKLNRFIWGGRSSPPFINTVTRFVVALEILICCRALGLIPLQSIEKWLYLFDITELHALFLYIISYIAGVNMIYHVKIFLEADRPARWLCILARFLFILAPLYCLYSNDFPESVPQYLDIRAQPHLQFDPQIDPRHDTGKYYAMWMLWAIAIFPLHAISSVLAIPVIHRNFDIATRSAYIQTYIHMAFIIGFARRAAWIDNLFCRCAFVGVASIVCGWLAVVIPVIALRSMTRAWKARRRYESVLDHEVV